jgi:hypothetical protein
LFLLKNLISVKLMWLHLNFSRTTWSNCAMLVAQMKWRL